MDEFAPAPGYHIERGRGRRPWDASNDDAAVGLVFDEAFAFEAAEGFADGCLADAEAGGDFFLAQVLTLADVAGHDRRLECFVNEVGLGSIPARCGHGLRIRWRSYQPSAISPDEMRQDYPGTTLFACPM